MGANGWKSLLKRREQNYLYFKEKLTSTAELIGERILETPNNRISIGIKLKF